MEVCCDETITSEAKRGMALDCRLEMVGYSSSIRETNLITGNVEHLNMCFAVLPLKQFSRRPTCSKKHGSQGGGAELFLWEPPTHAPGPELAGCLGGQMGLGRY